MPLELNKEQQAAADFLNGICVVCIVSKESGQIKGIG
jgi:hypothetical protein